MLLENKVLFILYFTNSFFPLETSKSLLYQDRKVRFFQFFQGGEEYFFVDFENGNIFHCHLRHKLK
jgi:hypothetical protein